MSWRLRERSTRSGATSTSRRPSPSWRTSCAGWRWNIARPKEAQDAGIDLPKDAEHRQAWIEQLVANPKAIQRPIITATDGTTVIARDPVTLSRVIASEH